MGMLMVMNRDVRVIGRTGNSIHFKKGKHTHVPDQFVEDCMAKGAIPVDAEAEMPQADAAAKQEVDAPVGVARKERIMDVFGIMVQENARGSFTANGHPKLKNLKAKLGFDVDVKEVQKLWQDFDAARKAESLDSSPTETAGGSEAEEHTATAEETEE